ncbi:MAG: flavoprotein [Phycisphaerae bacterium]
MKTPKKPDPPSSPPRDLADYEVLLAVTGGIAAYKSATLASRLVQRGAGVTVAMTAAAERFVAPLTFESLTARRVFTSLWESGEARDSQHLSLTERADLFIVAPATANILGKFAHGIADDLVSTLLLSAASPVLLAPAMNTRMWNSAAVQANRRILQERGILEIPPEEGWLACRTVGIGRMADPEAILTEAFGILRRKPPRRLDAAGD